MICDRWFFGRKTASFTLQWHLTNACPFHCRHCYDRSERQEPSLAQARSILADLQAFSRQRKVQPRLSLSGGDPLHYSHFWDLYSIIAQARIPTSILGNPIPATLIQRLLAIQPPTYYQVSLEGLRQHNDFMRGPGHFDRVMTFLTEARRAGLPTHVMLTLTRANLRQVLPLGDQLRGLTGRFTFNRLAQVGEAKDLEPPTRSDFSEFLQEYQTARRTNPVFGFKDNLFNLARHQSSHPLLAGCTGFGCGAAFNFVALLPEGEVHACRKFPSLLGNIHQTSLGVIYDSPIARQYRNGSTACRGCRLRKVCGGCLAVVYGQGLNPLTDRDPYCWMGEPPSPIPLFSRLRSGLSHRPPPRSPPRPRSGSHAVENRVKNPSR